MKYIYNINELNVKKNLKKSEQTKLKLLKERENSHRKKLANLETKLNLAETAYNIVHLPKQEVLDESSRCYRRYKLGIY